MKKLTMVLAALALFLGLTAAPAKAQDQTIVEIAAGNADFSTLVTAVEAAGLVETLSSAGPFTVFAPTNAAFEKLPEGTLEALLADTEALTAILTYHVVSGDVRAADVAGLDGQSVATVQGENVTVTVDGSTVKVNDSTVTATDIVASNGVIHVIDTVLIPPTIAEAMMAEGESESEAGEQTIVEIAAGNADFSTLVTAVQAAGLVDTLNGEGPFTVFAPTNAAFEKLPEGTLEALLADIPTLTAILTYHVVSGDVRAADVVGLNGQSVATVQGESVMVSVDGSTVKVNESTVTATDIVASNGVIHVIDTVLIPPTISAAMAAPATTAAPATMPTTGADNGTTSPVLPIAALLTGIALLGLAAIQRRSLA